MKSIRSFFLILEHRATKFIKITCLHSVCLSILCLIAIHTCFLVRQVLYTLLVKHIQFCGINQILFPTLSPSDIYVTMLNKMSRALNRRIRVQILLLLKMINNSRRDKELLITPIYSSAIITIITHLCVNNGYCHYSSQFFFILNDK